MSDAKNESNLFVLSAPAEIAFPPALFEKRKATPKAKERWEMALLFDQDHPDLAALKATCKRIAEGKSPGITADPKAWKYPWSSADVFIERGIAKAKADNKEPRNNEFMRGKVLFNSHSLLYEPNLSVLMPGRGVVDFKDEARLTVKDKFYAGCQVLVEVNFVWYPENNGPPCVTAYLNKVCSLNKGERRGGGKAAAETFSAYVGKVSAIDPTTSAAIEAESY